MNSRQLKFLKHLFHKGRLPIYVIFFLTEKCPNRCRHCFLGGANLTQRGAELSLEEIERISRSMGELMILLPTGGEPFLRQDLPEIIRIFYQQNGLRSVGMPTSGYDPKVVLTQVERILSLCPDLALHLEVSLDGFAETHNMIRDNPHSHAQASATHAALAELAKVDTRVTVGVTSVFSRFNQQELPAFYRHLRDTLKVRNYTLLLARDYPTDPTARDYDLTRFAALQREINADLKAGRLRFGAGFLSRFISAQRIIRNNLVVDQAQNQRYRSPCPAGTLAGVIRANGEVSPCESLEHSFGNLRESQYDFAGIWTSKEARRFVADTIEKGRCSCTHECFFGVNVAFNPQYLPEILGRGMFQC